jgi:hypothetical protein
MTYIFIVFDHDNDGKRSIYHGAFGNLPCPIWLFTMFWVGQKHSNSWWFTTIITVVYMDNDVASRGLSYSGDWDRENDGNNLNLSSE